MNIHTQIEYEGIHGYALVAIFLQPINILVGDLFVHSTHKTQFNPKIEHKLPDGTYKVVERKWLVHRASPIEPYLHITITDI